MHRLAHSLLLLSLLLAAVFAKDLPQSRSLKRRLLLPNPTGNSSLPSSLFDSPGSNRSLDPTNKINPAPTDPAAPSTASPSPSPPLSASPATKDSPLGDTLLPSLLGTPASSNPNPASPTLLPTPNNSTRSSPSGLTSLASSSTVTNPPPTPLPSPGRAQPSTTDASTVSSVQASPSPSPDSQANRTTKTPPHKKDDSDSGFGTTTIKLMGIIAAVVAGVFLLWTIIRKWKFRPSKRFAKKLDDYDEDVFAPRPPSFGEKRAVDHQAYSIPNVPNPGPAFAPHYPSYPERSVSPAQKVSYGNEPHGSQAYQAHRLSHISVTQPPAMFEPNPYRLSLGLGNPTHAYPPSDQAKPSVM